MRQQPQGTVSVGRGKSVGQSVGRQRRAVPPHNTHSCGAHGCAVVLAALEKGQCVLRQRDRHGLHAFSGYDSLAIKQAAATRNPDNAATKFSPHVLLYFVMHPALSTCCSCSPRPAALATHALLALCCRVRTFRDVVTLCRMHNAFSDGLMQYGMMTGRKAVRVQTQSLAAAGASEGSARK